MKINLFWYKHHIGAGNFGDELNPYIIERLSGKSIKYSEPWSGTKLNAIKSILYRLLVQRKIRDLFKLNEWNTIFNRKIVFGIGSIISCGNENVVIWGSGIIDKKDNIPTSQFIAVRGKYTQLRIKELGMKPPAVLGDPAVLLPLVYQPIADKKFKLGLIPHYLHYDAIKSKYTDPQIFIINLLNPIEQVISDICACEITLSTSLHGIIVSHIYQVPSLWVNFEIVKNNALAGDNIKFADYFSSVNIIEYQSVNLVSEEPLLKIIPKIKKNYGTYLLPDLKKVKDMQEGLLRVAPFPILKKYL